jgi:hypothetical protein
VLADCCLISQPVHSKMPCSPVLFGSCFVRISHHVLAVQLRFDNVQVSLSKIRELFPIDTDALLESMILMDLPFCSPSGKLIQIEYALNAVQAGVTSIGIKSSCTLNLSL